MEFQNVPECDVVSNEEVQIHIEEDMKIALSKFLVDLDSESIERASLEMIKEKITQREFKSGIIFMNASMYSDIRMWDRDKIELVYEKEKLQQGIMAYVFGGKFEIRVTKNVEENIFGIIEND